LNKIPATRKSQYSRFDWTYSLFSVGRKNCDLSISLACAHVFPKIHSEISGNIHEAVICSLPNGGGDH